MPPRLLYYLTKIRVGQKTPEFVRIYGVFRKDRVDTKDHETREWAVLNFLQSFLKSFRKLTNPNGGIND
jgi:hypothetical protein